MKKIPAVLNNGSQIIIDPLSNGECILNIPQTISQGSSIIVNTGKLFKILGNLQIQ
jgi:hypothetical protein